MAKAVNLTVHKSQTERARRKTIRSDIEKTARAMCSRENVTAFALVTFTDDGRAAVAWDTGGCIPLWAFPATVSAVLRQDIEESEVPEDFQRPLLTRAWKGSL